MADESTARADAEPLPIFVHSRVASYGLSPAQFRVYGEVARCGKCYAKLETIAKVCQLHRDTVIAALTFLTRAGLISKESHPGRTSTYRLTKISEWQPIGNGGARMPLETGHPSKPGTYPKQAAGGGNGGARMPLETGRNSNLLKASPLKGEQSPGGGTLPAAERITREKELTRVEDSLAALKRKNADAKWSDFDRGILTDLKERKAALLKLLGWAV